MVTKTEIKKVLLRKDDGVRYVIVPKKSEIQEGDYIKLIKIEEAVPA